MTKNPYEIRYDLLQMAKDMLDQQYNNASSMYWSAFEKAVQNNAELYKDYEQYIPKMFTPEEVIEQAEKLQTFINNKD